MQWGDQQALEITLDGVAGELVEQASDIGRYILVDREQAEVLVDARCLRVVVTGTDVVVRAQLVFFAANHLQQLAVCFQSNKAVHHVDTGLFELARPHDVVLLIKAGLDLNQRKHLLTGFCRLNQRSNNR